MELQNASIIILEGIPGAGKTTLASQISEKLAQRKLYSYPEETLLNSWSHGWIPGIDQLRLSFMESMVDYMSQVREADDECVFLLTRFHLTYARYCKDPMCSRYQKVVARLHELGAHVYVPIVRDEQIEQRAAHHERRDPRWVAHLGRRLAQFGCESLRDMYGREQLRTIALLESQPLAFQLLTGG